MKKMDYLFMIQKMRHKWVGKQVNLIEVICRHRYANEWSERPTKLKKRGRESKDEESWGIQIKMLTVKGVLEKGMGTHDNLISTLILIKQRHKNPQIAFCLLEGILIVNINN